MNYEKLNDTYKTLENDVKNALRVAVKKSRHTVKDYTTTVIPVNVYNYVALGLINDELTFIGRDHQLYSAYAECTLEDLIDILTKIPIKKDVSLVSKTKTITTIESHDFNQFVSEIYGEGFEFEAIQEGSNALYEFDTNGGAYNFGEFEKIRKGEYPLYCIHHLFRVLYLDGYLDAGDYVIDNRH